MTADGRGSSGRERLRYLSAAQHQVNTPLAVIRGWAETLVTVSEDLSDEDRVRGVRAIHRHVGDLVELLGAVFVEARIDAHTRREIEGPVDLAAAVAAAVDRAPRVPGDGLDGAESVDVAADDDAIGALVGAITEALSHADDGATVAVSVDAPGDRTAGVTFRAPGALEDPFEAFPGGDASPVGIRLSAARKLARALGGDLAVVDQREGLALRLLLPRA